MIDENNWLVLLAKLAEELAANGCLIAPRWNSGWNIDNFEDCFYVKPLPGRSVSVDTFATSRRCIAKPTEAFEVSPVILPTKDERRKFFEYLTERMHDGAPCRDGFCKYSCEFNGYRLVWSIGPFGSKSYELQDFDGNIVIKRGF